mmetsp:Transcript_17860/g.41190  ORF Transcript_17860/g.41190 Transcript_17860/m.41190 type:complete len:305 (-) Transcript_17860:1630-2544(-)|eukprot:CAMPEP_0197198920 /NCGR_PEP_ID=MMETSP1423-20130617/33621_1 /TAXON_ID=476441 /ORGANISM="Pseudo-nitzschia heimii, Strain UNC1101" /LENGTH=304 /DNA_ID=CAMNT_0042652767 /DNA_START=80 /DNA_END=994 /DNA_ORIENTATION=-
MNDGNDNKYADSRPFQTRLRENLTPFLPPPVVKAIKAVDPRLEPIVGPEASINIFGSLLFSWLLYRLAIVFFSSGFSVGNGKRNSAIQEDDRDQDILPSNAKSSRPYDETVLLCGPSLAGKTSIFYGMLQQGNSTSRSSYISKMKTVLSIKSNTSFLESCGKVVRILDTPGHWGPGKLLRVVESEDVDRLVVVVDSSTPVSPAADYLYAVLKSNITKAMFTPTVIIACHKSDHAKAKNTRRIKLQLRSELIRLGKLEAGNSEIEKINWEEAMNVVPLCSSAISDLKSLQTFCETGTLPLGSNKR